MRAKTTGSYRAMQSNYRKRYSYNVPSSTTLTYEGIFNSAYFKLDSKEEKKTINMEISLASMRNPLSNEKEVWLGTLLKSKYDGQKINKLIDLSIAIDVSGSMDGERINMAKKSLIQLIQKLNDEDNIAISKFDEESKPVFNYQKISELKKLDYISEIEKLEADGGTNILNAFKGAYNFMSNEKYNKNEVRRIIIITDMEDNISNDLKSFVEKISKENIYVTILGISESFRTDLAEVATQVKGANYILITNLNDINKYLVEEFDSLCFQNASNLKLEITAPNIGIERIIGSGSGKEVKKIFDKKVWNLEEHKFYSDDFKQKIFLLLLYFKRKDKILPKPFILLLSEFLVPGVKKEVSKIMSIFPSPLKRLGNKIYVEGGMILLRLDRNTIKNENIMKFEIKYDNELEKRKDNIDIEYSFKKEIIDNEIYFSDSKIETTLALFYFAKYNRRFMKICNDENKNKKYNKEYIKRKEFIEEKEKIIQIMKEHINNDNLNESLINEYLTKMEKNVENATNFCK